MIFNILRWCLRRYGPVFTRVILYSPANPWAPAGRLPTCCVHPAAATKYLLICPELIQVWRQSFDALVDPATFHGYHLLKQALGTLGSPAPQVALTTLGAHQHSRPRQAEALGRCLVGFELIFTGSWLARHSLAPFTQNSAVSRQPMSCLASRGVYLQFFDLRITTALAYFFLAPLLGASTINMVRPSNAGACSTIARSDSSSATNLRSSRAISG